MPFRFSRVQVSIVIVCMVVTASVGGYFWWKRAKVNSHADVDKSSDSGLAQIRTHAVKVKSAEIELYVKAPGIVDFHPKHALRIHPSFPGVVVKVNKNLGDHVNPGDSLASVESNVGVQIYTITSPIKGIVLSKNVSDGQFVSPEEELFSVGDASVLQARLFVSARDVKKVKATQEVILVAENQRTVRSVIRFLSPILSEDTRTASAIVDFNSTDLRPGMFVTGAIIIATRHVDKSLPASFCENSSSQGSLFVIGPKGVESRDVILGSGDYKNCEVLQGLELGDEVLPTSILSMAHEQEDDVHEHE